MSTINYRLRQSKYINIFQDINILSEDKLGFTITSSTNKWAVIELNMGISDALKDLLTMQAKDLIESKVMNNLFTIWKVYTNFLSKAMTHNFNTSSSNLDKYKAVYIRIKCF